MHNNQKFAVVQMVIAVCLAVFVAYLTKMNALPLGRDFTPDLSHGERLTYAFRCLAFSAIPLLHATSTVAIVRLINPSTLAANPTAPIPQSMETFKVYQRILQNTVEQTVLHIFAILALVSCLQVEQLWLIPLLVLLFVVGRAVFSIGYVTSPLNRVFGFALTVLPTVCSIAYAVITLTLQAIA